MGMKMIGVKGGSFDAWTPSLTRFGRMMGTDRRPDVPFALTRPRVTMPVTVGDYFLRAFPVTNAMYRRFVEETGHRRPEGKLVDFFWKRSRASHGTWMTSRATTCP
jgi:formylglycine-generating enzyme required for sulfatase activity